MKKKILGATIMAAIAFIAGWNISQSNNDVNLSDLTLENVEALASGETGRTCCPDPGDTCRLSSGDTLRDQDEC